MRAAWNDKQWLYNADGTLLGICLGFDHCAEHEWGINKLKGRFGLPQGQPLGLVDRTMTKGAEQLYFTKRRKTQTVKGKRYTMPVAILATLPTYGSAEQAQAEYAKTPPSGLYLGRSAKDLSADRDEIQTAWGDDGFSITAIGSKAVERLETLAQALMKLDGCISLAGAANPFGGNGLCLTIASRVPPEVRDTVLEADQAYIRLQEAAAATGIEKELKEAGIQYFALVPRWAGPGETSLRFWLNPSGYKHNHGWFSEKELRLAIAGSGPVVKQKEEANA